jgi:hypothetical protein
MDADDPELEIERDIEAVNRGAASGTNWDRRSVTDT